MSVSRRQPIHAHQFEHHSSLAKHVLCWVRTEYEPQDTGQSEGPSSSTHRQCLAPGSIGGFRLNTVPKDTHDEYLLSDLEIKTFTAICLAERGLDVLDDRKARALMSSDTAECAIHSGSRF